jgi:hypothetical protein
VVIFFNEDTGHYFQTTKCIRHGDPLYPMLFKKGLFIDLDFVGKVIRRRRNIA